MAASRVPPSIDDLPPKRQPRAEEKPALTASLKEPLLPTQKDVSEQKKQKRRDSYLTGFKKIHFYDKKYFYDLRTP